MSKGPVFRYQQRSKTIPAEADAVHAARVHRALGAGFGSDQGGLAAVEFAMLAMPTIMTIVVVMAIGLNFLYAASLDRAVLKTARAISTGAVSSSGMTIANLKSTVVCPALLASMTCNNVFVNVKTLTSGSNPSTYYTMVKSDKSGLTQPVLNSSQNSFCPGAGAQYVVVELAYPVPLMASPLIGTTTATYNGASVNVIMATATFLSEPYTGATSYAGC